MSSSSLTTTDLSSSASDSPPPTTAEGARAVRFDTECVLIPDPVAPSRLPHLVKKSFSLPIWKRPNASPDPDVSLDGTPGSPRDEKHLQFTVPVPSFGNRARSPSRADPHAFQPLVPCLVNHNHSQPESRRGRRRPSLPLPPRSDVVTVPLRQCCLDCYPITEESLKEGSEWQERFSRGARRRRNSSADAQQIRSLINHRRVDKDVPGFDAVILHVDEVDKRHGTKATPGSLAEPNENEDEGDLLPSLRRKTSREGSASAHVDVSPPAIAEEEEDDDSGDDLFPVTSSPSPHSHMHAFSTSSSSFKALDGLIDSLGHMDIASGEKSPSQTTPPTAPSNPESTPILTDSPSPSSWFASPESSLNTPTTPIDVPTSHNHPTQFRNSPRLSESPSASPKMTRTPSHEHEHDPHQQQAPGSPSTSWRRPRHIHAATNFFKVGVDVLKGVSAITGSPMSV